VLRLNDAYRGVGTGFVGRDDTWGYALQILAERPIVGAGLNNSGATDMGLGIHSGYLKNMAEFGMTGVLLNLVVIISVPLAFRRDWRLGAVMAGFAVVYIFNARNINLNIYPLMMWLALLPWLPERARRSPLPGAADGPKWRAGKIMPRLSQPAGR
jgi:O-antigen ligase